MSDQKPVKRDEALTWGGCSSIEVQLALAEFSAHLTAPDPESITTDEEVPA